MMGARVQMKETRIAAIDLLRQEMNKAKADIYLIPNEDFHGSEYVCDTFRAREFFSGFSGSAGTLAVTAEEAGLWTDGRYFIQAGRELEGSGIRLYKMREPGVPTILEYLKNTMKPGQILAFDGRCVSARAGLHYETELKKAGAGILYERDLTETIWTTRPALPGNPIWNLPLAWSGQSCRNKLELVRAELKKAGAEAFLLTRLDDLMWLFNIRGADVPCNPVALSYGYVDGKEAVLFAHEQALSEECRAVLRNEGVTCENYHRFYSWLKGLDKKKILIDIDKCNYYIYKILEQKSSRPADQVTDQKSSQSADRAAVQKTSLILKKNPTELLKAVKNPVELMNIREVYRRDSVAVIRFIRWIKARCKTDDVTEAQAAAYLDRLRSESKGFLDLSFPTICAYGANAAMMHYEAKEGNSSRILPEGLLLTDSGGQYMGGTTDVTRTMVLGEISREVKCQYTAVVKGMLALSRAVFLYGCTGRNLDILARGALWQMGIDYKCGTGHGIGYMLNVHEGPQNISWAYNKDITESVLEPGMLLSDEPGVYREGSHGIRIENILAVKEIMRNQDGRFLGFDTLTLVPVDREGIEASLMTGQELDQLDSYHRRIREELHDYLSKEEQEWLEDATKPIG